MMPCAQPAMVRAAEFVKRSAFDHLSSPFGLEPGRPAVSDWLRIVVHADQK
jgi:hypothetical protein